MNVALYNPRASRWAMTERGAAQLARTEDLLTIGRSRMAWDRGELVVHVNERAMPHATPVRGTVRLVPNALTHHMEVLDAKGRHRWRPIAPIARVEVDFDRPGLKWAGHGYFDSNAGDEPLEAGFSRWHWSRAPFQGGAALLYDAKRRDGTDLSVALHVGQDGKVEPLNAPKPRAFSGEILPLGKGFWRVERATRADPGSSPRVIRRLEDAPFYTRSLIETSLCQERVTAVHESLDLDRFDTPVVRMMLPFRMPRIAR
jgi:carotenoid 1,2-hydratase